MAPTWTQPLLPYPSPTDAQMQRLEQLLQHDYGYTLTGLSIRDDQEGWFVVLKVVKEGKPMVHFTGGRSWQDALEVLVWEVNHKALSLRPDQYAR